MSRMIDVSLSWTASALRLGAGIVANAAGPRPEQRLELYEFEGCPFCRRVREALTILDLQAIIYPCPHDAPTYRPDVGRRGGREQFPYLVDPNRGEEMYESSAIIDYLFRHYGSRPAPFWLKSHISMPLSGVASLIAWPRGVRYHTASKNAQKLELYSVEGSPYCRLVRYTLSELELPYLLHNVGVGSSHREAFVRRSGRMMVPWLHDPNTGVSLHESAAIQKYLLATYALPSAPSSHA